MARSFLLAIAVVVSAAACGHPAEPRSTPSADVASSTSDTPPAATAVPTSTATPQPDVWTGIADLDGIIRLELGGNGSALADRLLMKQVACTFHPEPLGYPPVCGEGEVEGQIVDVFPEGNCEGFLERPNKARQEITAVHPKTELYAVLAPPASQEGNEIGYWLVFDYAPPAVAAGFTYVVRGDRIVSRFGSCGALGSLETERTRLVPLLDGGVTRIEPVDQIIAAVEGANADTLVPRLSYKRSHFSQQYSPGDGLYCVAGEAEGAAIQVFSADGCSGTLHRERDAESLLDVEVKNGPPRRYAIGLPTLVDAQAYNYRLFFARGTGEGARGFELDVLDGRIVRFDSGCGPIARRAATVAKFLTAPGVPPSPSAPDDITTVGLTDIDEIVRLVTNGDWVALTPKIKTTSVSCGRPGDGFGIVYCGSQPQGTHIESVVTGYRLYESTADAIHYHLSAGRLSLYSMSRISPVGKGECGQRFGPAYSLTFSMVASPPFEGLALVTINVGGGQIVSIAGGCDTGFPPDSAAGLILRPPEQR
ncbi:MAG: hypothetical protein M3P30_06295 [Chloroflexota bacterium]|nr:hypothetical protein [Chloroflexota bacterium]